MDPVYLRLRKRARQIVLTYPTPRFYKDFKQAAKQSGTLFKSAPLIAELREFVAENVDDNFGHGMAHADKVSVDAGTLMIIEGHRSGYPENRILRRVLVAQCAGLLHDIKRKQKNHAVEGADYAREVLQSYRLSTDEIEDICQAILNHEAFKETIKIDTPEGLLVSDCLYDADKFRWGPDNFTDTLWSMIASLNPPLDQFIKRYPKGMAALARIKTTFRTATGTEYGPQFIDLGLAIGEDLYQTILKDFA
jgi:hypothetical protein